VDLRTEVHRTLAQHPEAQPNGSRSIPKGLGCIPHAPVCRGCAAEGAQARPVPRRRKHLAQLPAKTTPHQIGGELPRIIRNLTD
jgi:hypothetical protein